MVSRTRSRFHSHVSPNTWHNSYIYLLPNLCLFLIPSEVSNILENLIPCLRIAPKDAIWHTIPLLMTYQQYQGLSGLPVYEDKKGFMMLLVNFNIAHVTFNLMMQVMSRRPNIVLPPAQNGLTVGSIMGLSFCNWLFTLGVPDELFGTIVTVNCMLSLFYFVARVYLLAIQFRDYEKRPFFFI